MSTDEALRWARPKLYITLKELNQCSVMIEFKYL